MRNTQNLTSLKQAGKTFELTDLNRCGLDLLEHSLDAVETASAKIRKKVIEACSACVEADGKVTVEEAEVLRAIADCLETELSPHLTAVGAA